jgi:exoribonuclease R
MGNNSNRKKVLNILLFLSFLLCGLLVGFFVNRYYYNRDKGTQNQSKNTAIVSNQSNSSNSVMKSNSTNENSEWVCVFNDTNNCDTYYNPNRITNTLNGKKVWVKLIGEDEKNRAINIGAKNWAYDIEILEFNCQDITVREVSYWSYDKNGNLIPVPDNIASDWIDIPPDDGLQDSLYRKICKNNTQ